MGTTRRLHEHTRKIHCVAAEPAEAMHGLEGLKHMASSIVPEIYDPKTPDEILPISTEAGWDMAEKVAEEEGLFVGHSGGANIAAAIMLAERAQKERGRGCVVTVACDRGDRYFDPVRWEKKYVWKRPIIPGKPATSPSPAPHSIGSSKQAWRPMVAMRRRAAT
jgi:cysteine synthase B